ncbi:sulfatase family protein [Flexithrix dorotheae]|uniref:sulfatase family protein n=1 Tax=Flexithrix dorotheae TaxID=70993 RepID=UPI0003718ABD|nr:sulfatase [Flexithrix dorotheae]
MKKQLCLIPLLVILTLAACKNSSPKQVTQKPPNILFIFTDDHALQAISAYGSNINQTPNIDRLASEGMLFKHCMVTNSICGPSRAVIQTGKFSHLNGFKTNEDKFDNTQQTFPKLMQENGYQTAIFGKWHLKTEPKGYDAWKVLPGQGNYYNPDFKTPEGNEKIEGYVTDIVTDLSIEWLEKQRDQDKPFLLMSQHKAPHRRWLPNDKYLTKYDDKEIPEPATLFDDYNTRASGAAKQEMEIDRHMDLIFDNKVLELIDSTNLDQYPEYKKNSYARLNNTQKEKWHAAYDPKNQEFLESDLKGEALVKWKYQRYIKDYLRCVASVDENIGRLMDYLEKSGLAENTIVIYSSDQGFYLGEHGWFDKRWMYEESLHMPLIVKWPGIVQPGTINSDLVSNLDFAETLLDMAQIKIPEDMQGESLRPILEGNTPENWRKSVYYHYYEYPAVHMVPKHYGIRNDRYKLIYFYETDEWEFYDLETDPQEINNTYELLSNQELIGEMKEELKKLRQQYQDNTGKAV